MILKKQDLSIGAEKEDIEISHIPNVRVLLHYPANWEMTQKSYQEKAVKKALEEVNA